MKSIYLLIAAFLTTMISCADFLDTESSDFTSPDNFYKTEADLQSALAGVYDILGNASFYGTRYSCRFGNDADEIYLGREEVINDVMVFNFSSTDNNVTNLWQVLYSGIGRANVLLAKLDESSDISDEIKNVVRGEALFLRAFYYFTLAQNWGDVPLITKATLETPSYSEVQAPRAPLSKVYEQILNDMKDAEKVVKPISELNFGGRVSKSAVRGILARVCLTMAGKPLQDRSKYEEARAWADSVISDTQAQHALNPDYTAVFINYAKDLYDVKESIWEVEFKGTNEDAFREAGVIGAWNGITSSNAIVGVAYGFNYVTAKLLESYSDEDERKYWNAAPFRITSDGSKNPLDLVAKKWDLNCGKWRREYESSTVKQNNSTPQNFPLLRYSDVLLMYAEADNEINNGPGERAYECLNQVVRRAYGKLKEGATNVDQYDYSGTDYIGFQETIHSERSRELCFENLRKHDLIRWGTFLFEMKATLEKMSNEKGSGIYYALAFKNVSDKHLLLPIPSREMALNRALKQNPGW